MPKVLLVTNDFPPTLGGIQSYLRDFVDRLPAEDILVFCSTQDPAAASRFDAEAGYRVIRWPRSVMLPTPATAWRMRQIITENKVETVWFGAAAPLGLMARAAREAGASRIVATTHGHEVGWSMLPGARQALRRIFRDADVVTYISEFTRRRLRRVLGSTTVALVPSGVEVEAFCPANETARKLGRARLGLPAGTKLVVVISRLVPRKGQDQLIRSWPTVRSRFPEARLVIVGEGRYEAALKVLAARADRAASAAPGAKASGGDAPGARAGILFTGRLPQAEMRGLLAAADVFAMPARTRFGGLDVEGLGIVYLEAQASAVPVVAGTSGGAPETVSEKSGVIVDGRDEAAVASAILRLLGDSGLRERMGRAGREHVEDEWTMAEMADRLRAALGLG